jgi:hypothetical protein
VIAKRHRLFSNRLSQNCQQGLSDTTKHKIATNYLTSFDCQIAIAYLAIKERKIAKSI